MAVMSVVSKELWWAACLVEEMAHLMVARLDAMMAGKMERSAADYWVSKWVAQLEVVMVAAMVEWWVASLADSTVVR